MPAVIAASGAAIGLTCAVKRDGGLSIKPQRKESGGAHAGNLPDVIASAMDGGTTICAIIAVVDRLNDILRRPGKAIG